MTSRRNFLQASALAAAVETAGRAAHLTHIGVQLYTVRTVLPQNPVETLNAIHDIGYQEIEATLAGFDISPCERNWRSHLGLLGCYRPR